MERRTVLSLVVAGSTSAIAGCQGLSPDRAVADESVELHGLFVANASKSDVTATVRLRDGDETLLVETRQLEQPTGHWNTVSYLDDPIHVPAHVGIGVETDASGEWDEGEITLDVACAEVYLKFDDPERYSVFTSEESVC